MRHLEVRGFGVWGSIQLLLAIICALVLATLAWVALPPLRSCATVLGFELYCGWMGGILWGLRLLGPGGRARLWVPPAVQRPYVAFAAGLLTLDLLSTNLISWVGAWCPWLGQVSPPASAVGPVGAILVCPIMEELFFRGIMLAGLERRYGFWAANALSAVAFGLGHGSAPYALAAGVFGLLMGLLYRRTGSVLPCIGVHMFNNLMVEILDRWCGAWPGFAVVLGAALLWGVFHETILRICSSHGVAGPSSAGGP